MSFSNRDVDQTGVSCLFGSGVTMFIFVLNATELTELMLELKPTPQFRTLLSLQRRDAPLHA